jgi:cytidylate kinase
MYNVVTIAREYGSGGAAVGRALANRLGWNLLDNALVEEVARRANVDPALARTMDERVDSWIHRISKRALWHGAIESVPAVAEGDFFDAATMADLSAEMIRQAAAIGNCVIVGRGAQCELQKCGQVFHVFIYARMAERIARVRERLGAADDLEGLVRSVEKARTEYLRQRYGCQRTDPHLYDLMIYSGLGIDRVVDTIVCAAGLK